MGAYHSWQMDGKARYQEQFGIREETSLRVGDKEYIINQSGNVRELHGLLLQRQRTEDFIDSGDFVTQPQYDTFAGEKQLPDGRSVYELVTSPPDGQPETVDLDTKTLMVDRIQLMMTKTEPRPRTFTITSRLRACSLRSARSTRTAITSST